MLRSMLLVLALLVFIPAAQAQTFPKLTGQVVDAANLLSPQQEQALTAKLAALDKQSGRQVVVATVPDLQGYEIGDYAYQLGRSWGIGSKEKDDGTILLVAPNERKVWIATGYGVEGIVTDALASRIYRTAIIPRFKAGDFPGGIDAGVNELATLLTLPPEEAKARAAAAEAEQRKGDNGGGAVMLVFWVIVIVIVGISMFASRGGRGRRYRGGAGPVIIWGPSDSGWGSGGGSGWGSGGGGWGGGDGGGFSGGGGSFGGGGAGGSW
ncbi:TPM domain-containing protein [Sphingobium yanoikuyae]|uniref:TPM domain-containing protein n=2 Tax=Sphingobium yanoikuyae TaxID=13690 RepID=A0AA43BB49_SPHYA|nr:TPM domain-containing protein [Sphingobium yanoikuyae]MDH2132943.1 TPM domain-containing protein [Sphingobium yanoikuyae]MDH2168203.1 TPM domain-containing protein [Sphingobium yanoikuyae]